MVRSPVQLYLRIISFITVLCHSRMDSALVLNYLGRGVS